LTAKRLGSQGRLTLVIEIEERRRTVAVFGQAADAMDSLTVVVVMQRAAESSPWYLSCSLESMRMLSLLFQAVVHSGDHRDRLQVLPGSKEANTGGPSTVEEP